MTRTAIRNLRLIMLGFGVLVIGLAFYLIWPQTGTVHPRRGYLRIVAPSGASVSFIEFLGSDVRSAGVASELKSAPPTKGHSMGDRADHEGDDINFAPSFDVSSDVKALPIGITQIRAIFSTYGLAVAPSKGVELCADSRFDLIGPDEKGTLWTYAFGGLYRAGYKPEAATVVQLPDLRLVTMRVNANRDPKQTGQIAVNLHLFCGNAELDYIQSGNNLVEGNVSILDGDGKEIASAKGPHGFT